MNNRLDTLEKIQEFLYSYEKGLLLTGTHQFEKHPIVLKAISNFTDKPSSILFRANSMQNLGSFFEKPSKKFKTGYGYNLGNHKVFFDSFAKTSWNSTMYSYDFAILYPVDALMRNDKLYNDLLKDLYEERNINKIFLVSWTDRSEYDYQKLHSQGYVSHQVVFDALEENPQYHNRMLENDN
ncbi:MULTISPECIES: hypothetical protein [Paenibacillus]|uniref:Uncharacterized protein n=1 Tax=Paenibacillus lautus TaxID=1401 RepID=A0A1R1AKC2_PAELA|nr:hypothetical protein [Paenibacillus lautus]OME85999.1 hypothetical protein BK123_33270 [Paenibacillus lautus]